MAGPPAPTRARRSRRLRAPRRSPVRASPPEVDGLNAGYAALLLEQYLDNPAAVPHEWRALFESAPEELLAVQPGLVRLLERVQRDGNGHAAVAAPPTPAPAAADDELVGGVAAAMALV